MCLKMPNLTLNLCTICGKPVLEGEARYTITENHYDCERPAFVSDSELSRRGDEVMRRLSSAALLVAPMRKRPVPIGKGVVALRLKRKLCTALSEYHNGAEIVELWLWIQPPGYRGPKYDVACWGGFYVVNNVQAAFHSWDTMTVCAKAKTLTLSGKQWFDLEVWPSDS